MYYKESEESKRLMLLNKYYLKTTINNIPSRPYLKKIKDLIFNSLQYGTDWSIPKVKSIVYPNFLVNEFQHASQINELNLSLKHLPLEPVKIAIYTCIIGKYDTLKEPFYVNPNCDYYVITDQEVLKNSIWEKIDINNVIKKDYTFNIKNRYCKFFPHKIFTDYDYSIYLDGNIQIVADLYPLILRLDGHSIGMFEHSERNDIYTEANAIIINKLANIKEVKEQMNRYRNEGFPQNFGLREASIIVRNHKDKICQELMQDWWQEYLYASKRDQLSYPYCLWKKGLDINFVKCLGPTWRKNIRFINHKHRLVK